MILNPTAFYNCHVSLEEQNAVVLCRISVENPGAPQQRTELNQDFQTDESSVLAWFSLPAPEAAEGIVSIYQHKSWWIRPAFPESFSGVPSRTQLLLWKRGKQYYGLLAVCSVCFRGDISAEDGEIRVSVSANGCAGSDLDAVVCCAAAGEDPYRMVEDMVTAALKSQGRTHALRKNKQFPAMFDRFGWCTWDAFYHKVNEKDILAKLEEFKQRNVPVSWLLIDDGWSDADYETRKLNSLGADREKFPEGVGHTARIAKEVYGLRQVGVWHALMGYWTGLNPGTELFRQWEPQLMRRNGCDDVLRPEASVVFDFMNQWHSRLSQQEHMDFIKVDGQGSASIYYKGKADYSHTADYLRSLERSADKNFHGNLINCMGMAPQCMWLRENASLSRSSDDFVPEVPHGFREHILQNSFNSLLQGQFYWGDWDMFWSDHVENFQNSVARSVSGGPVYCSDRLGRTNPDSILPLLNHDGTVIRCEQVGLPTMDCLLADPLKREGLFKIYNTYAHGYAVAVFNIASPEHTVTDSLKMEHIPGLAGDTWMVYRYFAKTLEQLNDRVTMTLEPNEVEHLLLVRKQPWGQFLGNPEKYICTAAVLEQRATADYLVGRLAPASRVLFRADSAPVSVRVNGRLADYEHKNGYYEITCQEKEELNIEVRF